MSVCSLGQKCNGDGHWGQAKVKFLKFKKMRQARLPPLTTLFVASFFVCIIYPGGAHPLGCFGVTFGAVFVLSRARMSSHRIDSEFESDFQVVIAGGGVRG